MDKTNKKKFVKSYIDSAEKRIEYSQLALSKDDFSYVMRECQSITELCTKALIISVGFVVPKTHNLTSELLEIYDLFSKRFQNELKFSLKLLKKLRREREIALYGDIEEQLTPDVLYTKLEAQRILLDTQKYYDLCIEELQEFLSKESK